MAASTEQSRPYLNGVYFDHVCMVATNGRMLIKIENAVTETFTPFILSTADIKKIISLAKMAQKSEKRAVVVLEFDTETNVCAIGYGINDMEVVKDSVKYTPIDGTFPDYNRVIPTPSDSAIATIGLNASYVDIMGKAVKAITSNKFANIQLHFGDTNNSPMRVTAPSAYGFLGVLMPVRV